jgi:hypothetical protein
MLPSSVLFTVASFPLLVPLTLTLPYYLFVCDYVYAISGVGILDWKRILGGEKEGKIRYIKKSTYTAPQLLA